MRRLRVALDSLLPVLRFVAPFDHLRGVWFYVPVVLLGLLPGTLLLVPFLRFLLSGEDETAGRRSPELGFLLLAISPVPMVREFGLWSGADLAFATLAVLVLLPPLAVRAVGPAADRARPG